MGRLSSPQELEKLRDEIIKKRDPHQPLITVCGGTGCHASGCHQVVDAFKKVLQERAKSNGVGLRVTGCHGFCERGPLVVIHPQKIMYQRVKPEDAPTIFQETVLVFTITRPSNIWSPTKLFLLLWPSLPLRSRG
jgi:(2Fe-2S) ferredoxin